MVTIHIWRQGLLPDLSFSQEVRRVALALLTMLFLQTANHRPSPVLKAQATGPPATSLALFFLLQ